MARLVGVDLPREKRTEIALTYIYGIGRTRAVETLAATGIDPNKRARDLTDEEVVERVSFRCEQIFGFGITEKRDQSFSFALEKPAAFFKTATPPSVRYRTGKKYP